MTCKCNTLIGNSLHLHELINGLASRPLLAPLLSSPPLPCEPRAMQPGAETDSSGGSAGAAEAWDRGHPDSDSPAWLLKRREKSHALTPAPPHPRIYYTCMNYWMQLGLLRDLLHLHELVNGNLAFISDGSVWILLPTKGLSARPIQ